MKDSCHVLALGDFGYLVTFSYRDTIHIGVATLSMLRLTRGAATTKIENALIFERKRGKTNLVQLSPKRVDNRKGGKRERKLWMRVCVANSSQKEDHTEFTLKASSVSC